MHDADLIIAGAGPYGLSIAAHAHAAGLDARVVGPALDPWSESMPVGSHLATEGFASNLSDPGGRLTLAAYCAGEGRALPGAAGYRDLGWAVPAKVFTSYVEWFRRRSGVVVDGRAVAGLQPVSGGGHGVAFEDGSALTAPLAVVALGPSAFPFLAPVLKGLDAARVRHSSALGDPAALAGERVAVLGGGQSALESAALIAGAGGRVTLLVRAPSLRWRERPVAERTPRRRIGAPRSQLGDGWGALVSARTPRLLRTAPAAKRARLANRYLTPAGAWWSKDRVEGWVEIRLATSVLRAEAIDGAVVLHLDGAAGGALEVDQVVSATGYRPDAGRLRWVSEAGLLRMVPGTASPQLSRRFETSRPGLHVAGALAAASFGPGQLFPAGIPVAARAVVRAARRSAGRR